MRTVCCVCSCFFRLVLFMEGGSPHLAWALAIMCTSLRQWQLLCALVAICSMSPGLLGLGSKMAIRSQVPVPFLHPWCGMWEAIEFAKAGGPCRRIRASVSKKCTHKQTQGAQHLILASLGHPLKLCEQAPCTASPGGGEPHD